MLAGCIINAATSISARNDAIKLVKNVLILSQHCSSKVSALYCIGCFQSIGHQNRQVRSAQSTARAWRSCSAAPNPRTITSTVSPEIKSSRRTTFPEASELHRRFAIVTDDRPGNPHASHVTFRRAVEIEGRSHERAIFLQACFQGSNPCPKTRFKPDSLPLTHQRLTKTFSTARSFSLANAQRGIDGRLAIDIVWRHLSYRLSSELSSRKKLQ